MPSRNTRSRAHVRVSSPVRSLRALLARRHLSSLIERPPRMPTPSASVSPSHAGPSRPQLTPSCPEDHLPHDQSAPTRDMNVDTPSDTSPQSPDSDRHSPSAQLYNDSASHSQDLDPYSPNSPSYSPVSPSGDGAGDSRSSTMSPRPGSEGTATSALPDDFDHDKQMELDTEDIKALSPWRRKSEEAEHDEPHTSTDIEVDMLNCYGSPMLGAGGIRVVPSSLSSFLRPGSRFHGKQTSETQMYKVQVEIKHVDLRESFLCGYLHIEGLTEQNPMITTYFEGEIIGARYGFLTKHQSWGADERTDVSHWQKFSAFRPYAKYMKRSGGVKDFAQRENVFMRWKEHFLVPDHRQSVTPGASFDGFYYICFNQLKGEVTGIYYHARSENRFQQLELKHVPDRGCFSALEFR